MNDDTTARMRRTWDALARENAMHYIATERRDWELDEFLASGRAVIADLFTSLGYHPRGTALDLGCGIGRLSFALAERFDRVRGIDVSGEMVARARELQRQLQRTNVEFIQNDGHDLRAIPSGSCDLAFSFIVLQHVPDRRTVLGYIRELARVVRPGGDLIFQVPVYRETPVVYPWRLMQRLFRLALAPLERLRLVRPEKGAAFRGSRLSGRELGEALAGSGVEVVSMRQSASTYRFCLDTVIHGRKRAAQDPAHHGRSIDST